MNVNQWAEKVRAMWPSAHIQLGAKDNGAITLNACTARMMIGQWTERNTCWVADPCQWGSVLTAPASFYSVAADLT